MATHVYLIYADMDTNRSHYKESIANTKIRLLKCCNKGNLNLIKHNSMGVTISYLPIFVCMRGDERWTLPYSSIQEAVILAS